MYSSFGGGFSSPQQRRPYGSGAAPTYQPRPSSPPPAYNQPAARKPAPYQAWSPPANMPNRTFHSGVADRAGQAQQTPPGSPGGQGVEYWPTISTGGSQSGGADGFNGLYGPSPGSEAYPRSWDGQMHPLTQPNGYGNGNQGNYANMSALAPPPFQASYQNFDGSVTSQPMTNERDAFINRINQAMTPYAMNSGTQRTTMGPPQFDIQSLWGQAQNDAANGWTNPLAGLFG